VRTAAELRSGLGLPPATYVPENQR
jgi:hypothetical protein